MPHARCTVIVNGVTQSRKRKLKFTLSSSFGPRGHRLRTQCTIELNFECDVRAVRNRHELFLSRKSSTKCGNGERWEEEEASVLFFCEITVKFKLVNFQTILFLSLSLLCFRPRWNCSYVGANGSLFNFQVIAPIAEREKITIVSVKWILTFNRNRFQRVLHAMGENDNSILISFMLCGENVQQICVFGRSEMSRLFHFTLSIA